MAISIHLSFWLRKSKPNAQGKTPIYLRISLDGKSLDVATKRYIDEKDWLPDAGIVNGKSEEVRSINAYLDALRMKAYTHQREILLEGKPLTITTYKNKWHSREDESGKMLMDVFEDHNMKMKALIDKEYSPLTYERYVTSKKHTRDFMLWKYKTPDISITKIDYEFITNYEFWLKSVRNCDHNTTVKYLSNFRKIINICIKHSWLMRDPFLGFKMAKREVEKSFLSDEELTRLMETEIASERLQAVRDIFIFSCYTGLAYIDVFKLTRAEIATGIDGEKWVITRRQKTDTATRVPLLPPAVEILERYSDHPECSERGKLLPILSNQKMNDYLREIATLCGITKKMTFHTARHTFATTVTLTNGVPIETVSKMLGHRNLKTTQHYAKILDKKVSEDMSILRMKYRKATLTNSEENLDEKPQ